MIKRLLRSAIAFSFIIVLAVLVIAYGRGFRFNAGQKSLTSHGILSASSYPDKASILVNGKLTSATNASLTLEPGWYTIKIDKEGYLPWEREINIRGEVVSQVDALLIPKNPSLKALTVTGVTNPALSPSGLKIVYLVPKSTTEFQGPSKTGVWLMELKTTPLGGIIEPKPLYLTASPLDWTNAGLAWSQDEKQIMLTFFTLKKDLKNTTLVYLLSSENLNSLPLDVTNSYQEVLKSWEYQQNINQQISSSILPQDIKQILSTSSARLVFSADDSKLLYTATGSGYLKEVIMPPLIGSNTTAQTRKIEKDNSYVYDLKEDKNFLLIANKKLSSLNSIHWYTDSKHILTIENKSIYITDYDGTNKKIVYAGPFDENFIIPWPAGNKVLILTNFNSPKDIPNLYEIDLR